MANFNVQTLGSVLVEQQTPHVYGVQALFAQSSSWKNLGYYVAGAVWEEFESQGAPSANAPSGHSLIGLSSWVEG